MVPGNTHDNKIITLSSRQPSQRGRTFTVFTFLAATRRPASGSSSNSKSVPNVYLLLMLLYIYGLGDQEIQLILQPIPWVVVRSPVSEKKGSGDQNRGIGSGRHLALRTPTVDNRGLLLRLKSTLRSGNSILPTTINTCIHNRWFYRIPVSNFLVPIFVTA